MNYNKTIGVAVYDELSDIDGGIAFLIFVVYYINRFAILSNRIGNFFLGCSIYKKLNVQK